MIRYRFGIDPLTRRDAYAQNIARSFDWESAPRLTPPDLPDPPSVAASNCSNRPPGTRAAAAGEQQPAPERPHQHDLVDLRDSGYLERLGFDYRPATLGSTFREPTKVGARLTAV